MPVVALGIELKDHKNTGSWFKKLNINSDFIHKIRPIFSEGEFFPIKAKCSFFIFSTTQQKDVLEAAFFKFVQQTLKVPETVLSKCQIRYDGAKAIEHFFKLSIGMEKSLEIDQNVQEFRDCFLAAREAQITGPYFNKLFQRGLWLSEKMRIELNLQKKAITAETVVAEIAQKIFGELLDRKALIAANSYECENFVEKLQDKNIGELYFVDFNGFSPPGLIEQFRGIKVEVHQLSKILPDVDLILVFDEKMVANLQDIQISRIMNIRNNAPLLYISYLDEAAAGQNRQANQSNVYNLFYYNKYDLERIVDTNLIEHQKITTVVNNLLEKEIQQFLSWVQSKEYYRSGDIIGKSLAMQKILELVARISQTDISVFIDGESGTGKEMVAYAIHEHSSRAKRPFVVVNCGAIPENLLESELFGHVRGAFTGATANKKGLFEAADGGTIFLDEIGETSFSMQVKLLRFLQEGEIKPVGSNQTLKLDVRLITATNKDLELMVEEGAFRQDLFYRLNVIQITIPPLRERKEDILPLAEFFIKKYARKMHKTIYGLDEESMQILDRYDWPGNVRELENVIERALALSSTYLLTKNELPPNLVSAKSITNNKFKQDLSLKELEKIHITNTLNEHNWNYDLVAQILGIGRTTLWRKMKEYAISPINSNN